MSGFVQEHIDALEAAKVAATAVQDQMLSELTAGASGATGALEGIDAVIAQRIGDVVDDATRALTEAINAAFEGVVATLDAEIAAAEGILEHA